MTLPSRISSIAFLSGCLLIFWRLGGLPLVQPDEGRNAEVAREMNNSGAWLIPTYDGLAYLDKPAFYFKIVALSFRAFGETEFAARLPSALFGILLLLTIFAFCRREYGNRTAAIAVLVVSATPLYMALSRAVIFDVTLAVFVSVAI